MISKDSCPTELVEALHRIEKGHLGNQAILKRPDLCHRLANRLGHEGHLDVAERMMSYALSMDDKQGEYYADYGMMLLHLKRYSEAGQALSQALALGVRHACITNGMGQALLRQGRPAKAADAFSRSISMHPDSLAALHGLAESLIRLQDYEGAESTLKKALHIAPQSLRTHRLLDETWSSQEAAAHSCALRARQQAPHAPSFFIEEAAA